MDKHADRINILMLSWEIFPYSEGGLGRHVYELSKALSGEGASGSALRVFPFCGAAGDHAETAPLPAGPPEAEIDAGIGEKLRFTYQAPDLSVLRKIDEANFQALAYAGDAVANRSAAPWIIHAHDWQLSKAATVLKGAYGFPLVATFHTHAAGRQNTNPFIKSRIDERESELARSADAVVAVSKALSNEIASASMISQSEISVIPNGVHTPDHEPDRDVYAIDGSPCPLVLFIGRLVPEKGVDQLLEALAYLRSDEIWFKCMILGDGPERPKLEREAERLGLAGYVEFRGRVPEDEKTIWLRKASVVVIPSRYEPFGIVALEAMAAGAPVVVSEVGGLAEIVSNGQSGLTFRAGDIISLSFNIRRLLKDRALAEHLAREAYRHAASDYRWESVAQETLEIYQRVLMGRKRIYRWKRSIMP